MTHRDLGLTVLSKLVSYELTNQEVIAEGAPEESDWLERRRVDTAQGQKQRNLSPRAKTPRPI